MGIRTFLGRIKNKSLRLIKRYKISLTSAVFTRKHEEQLEQILSTHKDNYTIIFPPLVDWNIPLFQRPQHIALNLAKIGYPYFYCTTNEYDNISGIVKYEELYITNMYNFIFNNTGKKIFHMYAQDFNITKEMVDEILDSGNIILYEYIDALTEQLCASKSSVIDRHLTVLKDERCLVVCTANNLYEEVAKFRKKNFKLVTNGVDIAHFSKRFEENQIPHQIKHIVSKNKPIIGYFGALAKWFDYNLVEKLAKERPDYEILLIGWDFDNSLKQLNLSKYENITVVGPINYKDLPSYAYWFSVSTIPFQINEITESTSPIKLFEYMALGHPIVTTNMPECRKYVSVLIGRSHDEFIKKIDDALKLSKDKEYNDILRKEALENTWEAKAREIDKLIGENI